MYAHHAHSNVRCFDLDLTAIGAQPPSATSLLVRPPSPPRSTSPLPATCLEGWVARNTGVAAERPPPHLPIGKPETTEIDVQIAAMRIRAGLIGSSCAAGLGRQYNCIGRQ